MEEIHFFKAVSVLLLSQFLLGLKYDDLYEFFLILPTVPLSRYLDIITKPAGR